MSSAIPTAALAMTSALAGAITVAGGQNSTLPISYNLAYGGASQAYTVTSTVGTVYVTVYPRISVTEIEMERLP